MSTDIAETATIAIDAGLAATIAALRGRRTRRRAATPDRTVRAADARQTTPTAAQPVPVPRAPSREGWDGETTWVDPSLEWEFERARIQAEREAKGGPATTWVIPQ